MNLQQFYIIRHCKAEGQSPEARLTQEGKEQAESLADFLADREIDYIVSSPFVRAIETSEPLAVKTGCENHLDQRLAERVLSAQDLPDWLEHLKRSFADVELCLPGGESSRAAAERIVSVINELRTKDMKNIAVVTHGNLLTLLLKHFDDGFSFEEWQKLTNPDVYRLTFGSESVEVARIWV